MNANRDILQKEMRQPQNSDPEDNGEKRKFWSKVGVAVTIASIILFILWEVF